MSIDLYYTSSAAPVFFFVPQFYTLSPDTSGEMLVRTKKGVALYQSDAGIETVEILLNRPLKYPDGTIIPAGETVDALRVAPELQGLGDVENEKAVVLRYGLTVSDPTAGSWHISGLLTVNPDTGKIKPACGPAAVCVGQIVVAASVCGVQTPPPSIFAGGYAELEFRAADLASGEPLIIATVSDYTLITQIAVQITEPFDNDISLFMGQADQKKEVYKTADGEFESYITEYYKKFSGALFLFPDFFHAPATGAGVIYVQGVNMAVLYKNSTLENSTETVTATLVLLEGASTAIIPEGAVIYRVWYRGSVAGDDGDVNITVDGSGTDITIGTLTEAELTDTSTTYVFDLGWVVGPGQAGVLKATKTGTPTAGAGNLYALYSRAAKA